MKTLRDSRIILCRTFSLSLQSQNVFVNILTGRHRYLAKETRISSLYLCEKCCLPIALQPPRKHQTRCSLPCVKRRVFLLRGQAKA